MTSGIQIKRLPLTQNPKYPVNMKKNVLLAVDWCVVNNVQISLAITFASPTSLIIERARLTLVIGRAGLKSESEPEELDDASVVMIGTALRIGGEL